MYFSTIVLLASFCFKDAIVFSEMIFKEKLLEYSSDKKNQIKTFDHKKEQKNLMWEPLLIFASTSATIVLVSVEKGLIEKKVAKSWKFWQKYKTTREPDKLFKIEQYSRYQVFEIARVNFVTFNRNDVSL